MTPPLPKREAAQERPGAEEMGTAGNIKKQPIPAIKRHQRRVVVAPVGNAIEQAAIGGQIFFHDLKPGTHGARLRHALAFLEANRFRHLVKRRQPHGIVEPPGADDGRGVRTPAQAPGQTPLLAGDPVG